MCVGDKSTGFALEEDKWTFTRYDNPGKYIVKLDAEGSASFYDFGENPPEWPNCVNLGSYYSCRDDFAMELKFNREMNRFAVVHFMPYLREDKTGNNWLAIGACSKI